MRINHRHHGVRVSRRPDRSPIPYPSSPGVAMIFVFQLGLPSDYVEYCVSIAVNDEENRQRRHVM